jgi:alkanesulfonate monooxygenase SsuD/methylene tetrahydromethanopterin reductase-like flavin-dependent oxidoreductase (luciferase family)
MEIGLLYDLRNPPQWRIPTAELYAETLDHIQAMEDLGFPLVWVTEHHFIEDEYLPSCLAFAAAIAARTKKVTIGTAVLLLPLHDAIRVAEDCAVVDQLSNGRLRLGVGLGYKIEEFETFGIPRKARKGRIEEGVEVIRAAWADGPVHYEGRHYRLNGVEVTPKPAQRPGPPIWMGGRAEAPVRRAARMGDGLIAAGEPELNRIFAEEWRAAGKEGTPPIATFAWAYPADDPGAAWETVAPHSRYRAEKYADWYGAAADLQGDTTWRAAADAQLSPGTNADLFRTPDEVVESLLRMEAEGATSAVYFATFPGLRPSATIPYFELMAKHVLPRVSR